MKDLPDFPYTLANFTQYIFFSTKVEYCTLQNSLLSFSQVLALVTEFSLISKHMLKKAIDENC